MFFFSKNCCLHVTAKRSGLERKLLISYVTSSNSIEAFIFLPFQNVLNIFSWNIAYENFKPVKVLKYFG